MTNTEHGIAVFDFDGTITSRDTFNAFLIYSFGKFRFYAFCFLKTYLFLAYFVGAISNQSIKEAMARHFLRGMAFSDYEKKALVFSFHKLPQLVKKNALRAIDKHRELGQVVIISASLGDWIRPWAKKIKIDNVTASTLEAKNGLLTGKFSYNCYGERKKEALLAYLGKRKRIFDIHVYADSKGDRELLSLATHKHYKEF